MEVEMTHGTEKIAVIVPIELRDMVQKLTRGHVELDPRFQDYYAYVNEEIYTYAQGYYVTFAKNGALPKTKEALKLFYEVCILRGVVHWHEKRDKPPPPPDVNAS